MFPKIPRFNVNLFDKINHINSFKLSDEHLKLI